MYPRIIIASLYTLFVTVAGFGQGTPANSKNEVDPIHWPIEPRPKLGATSYFTDFDGISVPMYRFQGDGISFELASRRSLRVRQANSNRYSGELTDSRIPGVSLGVSIFREGEFLSDLSEESWDAYKASLAIDKPDVQVVLENSNIDQPTTPYVFGAKFRQIVYEQKTSRGIIKRREIFAFVGTNLLVFTITGTKESVDKNWTSVEHLIGEMSLS